MAKVYANGREILSEGDHGKVKAAFPDVCNSPPAPPAGPVPVPYANSSRAGDLKRGSKRVCIDGKPVGLRDKSYLQPAKLGNEAATRSFGGNLVTHQVTGKSYFGSWSHDVEVEGKGVLRHLDVTTSNHGSYPGGTPPFPNLSSMHQLALSRVEAGQCPCCGSEACAAAFQPGEEPLTMKEAMGMQPGLPNYNENRATYFKMLREDKKKKCSCDGKVFPSPPCDVFRAPDKARHDRIEIQWEDARSRYQRRYGRIHGVQLRDWTHFAGLMKQSLPAATQAAMLAASKLPKSQRAANPSAKLLDNIHQEARKLERVNHLTPKEYGGCPTNPDNLQPQQLLCKICQDIDQFMTDTF